MLEKSRKKQILKKGDYVIALGDGWVTAGSIGEVVEHLSERSVRVLWHTVAPESAKETKKGIFRSKMTAGMSLFHSYQDLELYEESNDPNFAFRRKCERIS